MINLGLQRITQLLNPLFSTHPTLPWRAVHIAGTNGKGSVAALVSTFLGHLGYKVGRFTSPHLIDRWDCISLNRRVVERDKFLQVEQHFRDRSVREDIHASEFEILTAAAFQLFTDAKVDVAVIECGLGGRLDATNVLRPEDVLVSVLTKVGLDHTAFLGETLEAIATEKVGIFKPGVPVVLDQSNQRNVIDVAESRLRDLGWEDGGRAGVYISVEERRREFDKAIARMRLAKHQAQNLYLAFSCFQIAEERLSGRSARREHLTGDRSPGPLNFPQDFLVATDQLRVDTVKKSLDILVPLAQSSLPGRLQWIVLPSRLLPQNLEYRAAQLNAGQTRQSLNAKVLLDGAHNSQSAAALADYIKAQWRPPSKDPVPPVTWLLSVKNDKKVDEILQLLLGPNDNVLTCSFGPVDGMPWVKSMGAIELAEIATKYTSGIVEALGDEYIGGVIGKEDKTTPDEKMRIIIRQAVSVASRDSKFSPLELKLCITGSLYLVGDVLRCIRNAGGPVVDGSSAPAPAGSSYRVQG
ncbi:hypothetical protein AYO21_02019 [Fonsecaea monophora]|uniref:Mur ligase central domain-containing protein n=1 Tax=Fonsecaea monophora TaxID=254056 RepID=A0A177FK87_9EURO|nr:hypothetical protein AYO21_02019 [Fonsecaea monophora]OAG43792.1 hypothetical protein AYO21_02019 [Fonsecaea monophora]